MSKLDSPQLLNEVGNIAEAARLTADASFWLQPKYDGHRVLVHHADGQITARNRRLAVRPLPQVVADAIAEIAERDPVEFLLDGELVGDRYYVFDLLGYDHDLRDKPYSERLPILSHLLSGLPFHGSVQLTETAMTAEHKARLIERLQAQSAEGYVLKRHDAPYTSGRPNAGGAQLKVKFWKTASVLVAGPNGKKHSVAIALLDAKGEPRPVGHVTIPQAQELPPTGAVIEVRYLYATKKNCMYIAIYHGERDDIEPAECTLTQLKYKGEEE